MVTFLTIGDPHFKVSNIQESREMIDKICDLVEKRTPDFVVCLGDILHTHDKIHIEALCLANEFIERVSRLSPIYVLIGNHDRCNNSDFLTTKHAFNGMKERRNIEIIDVVKEFIIKGKKYIMVPYVPPGRFMEALNTIDDPLENTSCIFAHQEFKGVQMGSIVSEHGDEWDESYPLVISGHIHSYSKLSHNILYVGTPMQHTFGEAMDKTVSLFDDNMEERIDLHLKKRVLIRMNIKDLTDRWRPSPNCLTKLILSGTESETKSSSFNIIISDIRSLGVKVDIRLLKDKKDKPEISKPNKTFSEVLREQCKKDENLYDVYQDIFDSY